MPATDATVTRLRRRAMGCDASITVEAADAAHATELAELAVGRLVDLERRWSRFRDDSEVTALNHAAGRAVAVSADTVRLVTSLVAAWHATDGAFDPTLLEPIVGLGYAASRDDARRRTAVTAGCRWRGEPAEVLVDADRGVVRLPPGTAIDPGGLGKGLAADLVVDALVERGAATAVVEIGGDVAVASTGDPVRIAVAPVAVDGIPTQVALVRGGVATSGTSYRRWRAPDGRPVHHLLDPSTGAPATGEAVACTVVAGTAAWAEAFAKLPFVRGVADAVRVLDERGLAAAIVTTAGTVVTSLTWQEFTS